MDDTLHSLTASLFLIYMDTLMRQIFDIVQKEKRKQAWVPIAREVWSIITESVCILILDLIHFFCKF